MTDAAMYLVSLVLAFILGGVFGAGTLLMLAWRELIDDGSDEA